MKVWFFVAFYFFLATATVITYRMINPKWISYSKAEKLYKNKRYDLAIDYYSEFF